MGALIGIDIGTTGTKVVLLEPITGRLTTASRPSALSSAGVGWAEAEPGQWWQNTCDLIPEVLAASGTRPSDVDAVATTGMVPAVIPIGAAGPLRSSILQNDARAVIEVDELAAELAGLDLVGLTGSPLTQQSVAPTLRWLSTHEPGVVEAADWIVGSYDWMLVQLGAAPHIEQNWALESGFYGIDGTSIDRVVDAVDARRLLPPVAASGSMVGEVSARAAAATGLAAGTRLVVGGADHVLSAASAGLHQPGTTLVKLGGAGDILTVSASPVTDARLYLDAHPSPGLWLPNGCMATSGSLLRWLQSLLGNIGLDALDEEAAAGSGTDLLCLPYLLGEKSPHHDPDLRGAFVGLHIGHTRADFFRAALEAVAFGFRQHLEIFDELGMSATRVHVTNGGSRSLLWKQIIADVCGHDLIPIQGHPGAAFGAAIAAGIATGAFTSWADSSSIMDEGGTVFVDRAAHERYDEQYALWCELAERLEPVSHALARRSRT